MAAEKIKTQNKWIMHKHKTFSSLQLMVENTVFDRFWVVCARRQCNYPPYLEAETPEL